MIILDIFHKKELPIYELILNNKLKIDKAYDVHRNLIEDCLAVYAETQLSLEELKEYNSKYFQLTTGFQTAIEDLFLHSKWHVSFGMYEIFYWMAENSELQGNDLVLYEKLALSEESELVEKTKLLINKNPLKPVLTKSKFCDNEPRKFKEEKQKKEKKPSKPKPKSTNSTYSLF